METDTGWWDRQEQRAQQWLHTQIHLHGSQQTGPLTCMSLTGCSCLLRVPIAATHLYFKACRLFPTTQTRPIFSSEVPLTQVVSALFPRSLPQILAAEPEAGWMLLYEAGPQRLQDLPFLTIWGHALTALAQIHRASSALQDVLLHAGCADRRLHHLTQDIDEVLHERAMWSHVPPSQVDTVRRALPLLERACRRLALLPIPATLVHGDLHARNVVVHDGHPVFLDWSDACLAHPFFDVVIFCSRTRPLGQDPHHRQSLRDTSLAPWQHEVVAEHLAEAFSLAEVLVCAHQLVSYRRLVELEASWQHPMRDGMRYWLQQLLMRLHDAPSLDAFRKCP